jgi:hypothetical protein
MRRFWEGNAVADKSAVPRMMALRKNDLRASRNLVGAAEQHVLWKNRLAHHIQGHIKEAVDIGLVGQSGVCQLGAWIKGAEFHQLRGTQAYRELDFAHALFHEYGAQIVTKLEQGDRAAADAIYKNEYSLAMQHVIQALTKINLLLQN